MKTIIDKLNDTNSNDFTTKTDGEYRRQLDKDITFDNIEKTDWDKESYYHNSVRVNGKNNIGRTIKMSNKEWHRLNKTRSK